MCDSGYTYISQDKSPVVYMGWLCRICLMEEEILHAFRVKTECENMFLHEIYTNVTSLEISESDGLPIGICLSCCDKLVNAYLLKKQALLSYKSLCIANVSSSEYTSKKADSDRFTSKELDNKTENYDYVKSIGDKTLNAVEFLTQHKFINSIKSRERSVFNLNDKRHECHKCEKKFLRKSNLIDHLRLHANLKLFNCEYCNKSFVQIGNFRSHLRIHTKERPFACNICSKSYNQSSALKIHIRSHTNERNYICEICAKGFTNSSDLNKHKIVHDPSKHIKCDFCNRLFAQKSNLRYHQKKVHMNNKK